MIIESLTAFFCGLVGELPGRHRRFRRAIPGAVRTLMQSRGDDEDHDQMWYSRKAPGEGGYPWGCGPIKADMSFKLWVYPS